MLHFGLTAETWCGTHSQNPDRAETARDRVRSPHSPQLRPSTAMSRFVNLVILVLALFATVVRIATARGNDRPPREVTGDTPRAGDRPSNDTLRAAVGQGVGSRCVRAPPRGERVSAGILWMLLRHRRCREERTGRVHDGQIQTSEGLSCEESRVGSGAPPAPWGFNISLHCAGEWALRRAAFNRHAAPSRRRSSRGSPYFYV